MVVVGASVVTGLGVDGALTLRLLRRRLLSSQASPGEIKSASSAKASKAQIIFAMIVSLKKKKSIANQTLPHHSNYSLSQNGWDTMGSPCPLNVGVQDLVTEPR